MRQITQKWAIYKQQLVEIQDTGAISTEFPEFEADDDDNVLQKKFQDLLKIGNVLDYLTGYCTFLKGHLCVIYKNRPDNTNLTQESLNANLQNLLGVAKRTVMNYFAYYVSLDFLFDYTTCILTYDL